MNADSKHRALTALLLNRRHKIDNDVTMALTTKKITKSPSSASTLPNWSGSCHLFLISVIALQWLLVTVLVNGRGHKLSTTLAAIALEQPTPGISTAKLPAISLSMSTPISALNATTSNRKISTAFEGVAATIIFRAPRWFHLRYTLMIHNALANIPDTWGIHIFYHTVWVEKELLPWHPALQKLLEGNHPRIIATPLPEHLMHGKPKHVLQSEWLWKNMAADRVLLFSGNGAFCGNHDATIWQTLEATDYCGVPHHRHDRLGGSGATHSYRNRTAMLQVIDYHQQHGKSDKDIDVVPVMLEMNAQAVAKFRVATAEQTLQFGGSTNLSDSNKLLKMPLAVSGIQSGLSYAERDSLLKHCPEIKAIFPSLHEPACFGAHPVKDQCQATICALQEPLPRGGC
jgi:hypothetical protein